VIVANLQIGARGGEAIMQDGGNYWQRQMRGRYSRRSVLRATALGAAAMSTSALLACGTKSGAPSQSTTKGSTAGGSPQSGGTYNTYNNVNLGIIDPQGGSAQSANGVLGPVYSHPFQFKSSSDQQTILSRDVVAEWAVSGESPDGQTWTLKIQPNLKWQNVAPVNGRAVDSADVKASFTRAFAKPENTYKGLYPMIDPAQIETPSADTVVFKLKFVYGPFKETMAGSGVELMPREALAGTYDPAKVMIGSGPFMLDSYTPDVAYVLKKNPTFYQQGRPYVDTVRGSIVPDPAQALAQFTAGNLDELRPAPNDVNTAKQNNPKATVISQVNSTSYAFFGHMNDPASAWHDIRIRQAVSMAIDRDTIKKVVLNGQATENQIVPKALGKWMLPLDKFGGAQQYYQYKPDEAKKLLAATSGGPQLTRFMSPAKNYGPAFDQMAETIVSMLNSAGFKIQLVPIDYTRDFIGGGKGALYGNYPPDALVYSADALFSNAEETLASHFESKSQRNKPQVSDPQLDEQLSKMLSILDENQRLQAALDIQKYLAGQIYQISTYSDVVYTLLQPWVHNFYLGESNQSARYATPNLWVKK
jgi:peptide/nickel transport system substrate-binding protein